MNAIRCLQQEKLNRTVVRLGREASSEDDQATCSQGHGLCKDLTKVRWDTGKLHRTGRSMLGVVLWCWREAQTIYRDLMTCRKGQPAEGQWREPGRTWQLLSGSAASIPTPPGLPAKHRAPVYLL